jgi:hypothetical protein
MQSIAREFGPQGVHSAFVVRFSSSHRSFFSSLHHFSLSLFLQVLDGVIITDRTAKMFGSDKLEESQRLHPVSVAKCYWWLHNQTPDAWTQELDLRPAKEKF